MKRRITLRIDHANAKKMRIWLKENNYPYSHFTSGYVQFYRNLYFSYTIDESQYHLFYFVWNEFIVDSYLIDISKYE